MLYMQCFSNAIVQYYCIQNREVADVFVEAIANYQRDPTPDGEALDLAIDLLQNDVKSLSPLSSSLHSNSLPRTIIIM